METTASSGRTARSPAGDGWDAEERQLELQLDAARSRTRRGLWRFLAGLVLALLAAWLLRWDVTPVVATAHPPYVIVLDRWTGELFYVQQATRMRVTAPVAAAPSR